MFTKAEEKYIEIMKKKTGQERLRIAMDLRKIALKLAETAIRSQHPNFFLKKIKQNLQKRIYGYSFPFKNSSK